MRKGDVSMAKTHDHGAKSSGGVVTAGPWSARDSYVAETAVTIDRLTAKLERLERREDALKQQVAELQEHAQQSTRFQSLAESLRNSRDYKLDEMVRLVKELRAREGNWTMAVARYNAGPTNTIGQRRYICSVIGSLVASGFGSWTSGARAFCNERTASSEAGAIAVSPAQGNSPLIGTPQHGGRR